MSLLPEPTLDMPDLFESDDEQSEHEEEQEAIDPYEEAMFDLIDEVTLGLCFEVHRSCKLGTYLLDDSDESSEYQLVDERGLDVFGQLPTKKQFECLCPNCNRNIAASRFAPHLEKCMGMGRNSSRIASRRIANANAKKDSDNESEADDDNDWSYAADRKVKKLKKDKGNHSSSPRRGKNSKHRGNGGGDIPSVGSTKSDDSNAPYENMSMEERKALLLSTCGVISEHTKKMCTRSGRCPQHTDEQRRSVRHFLLGTGDQDDVVDIDTYDDTDSQSLRESLQWEAASNPSPADSTSSNSKKRKHGKGSKKKSSKSSSSASNSRGGTPTGSVLMGYLVSK